MVKTNKTLSLESELVDKFREIDPEIPLSTIVNQLLKNYLDKKEKLDSDINERLEQINQEISQHLSKINDLNSLKKEIEIQIKIRKEEEEKAKMQEEEEIRKKKEEEMKKEQERIESDEYQKMVTEKLVKYAKEYSKQRGITIDQVEMFINNFIKNNKIKSFDTQKLIGDIIDERRKRSSNLENETKVKPEEDAAEVVDKFFEDLEQER